DQIAQRDILRRRRSEYAARVSASEHEAQHYAADLAAHRIEAEGLAEQIRLAGESETVYRALVDKGLASKVRLIEATEHRVDATWRLDTNRGEQQTLIEQIAEA